MSASETRIYPDISILTGLSHIIYSMAGVHRGPQEEMMSIEAQEVRPFIVTPNRAERLAFACTGGQVKWGIKYEVP